ncbi:MAG: sigma 54-dependent Fis family transcriptional regulator [Deltaproteobacteria bacterium]|nr:sigma 54-dependent Fis family transcriptional regulator [Deltaproteobacteria bacterium]
MNDDRTIPNRPAGLPVRGMRLEVLRGPDVGRILQARGERMTIGTASGNDLQLTDPTVSRYHLELERRADHIVAKDLGSTNGTHIGRVQLQDQDACISLGTTLDLGQTSLRVDDGGVLLLELRGDEALGGLRGRSTAIQRLMATVANLAENDASVLVMGESGTGKDVVARAIHELGPRARHPFVTVDCGAVTPNLFASELFGHERGAFTGADRRHLGAFERASGGTLFLDEIGELPAAMQAALLGALERRRIRRVGGTEELDVDVRVVSATNRDLRAEVNKSAFRLDLYYRLAVVLVTVPALREHLEDIPDLVEHFLRETGEDRPLEALFPPAAMQELQAHRWPGNVRELRNLVEATLATGQPVPLGPSSPASASTSTSGHAQASPPGEAFELSYREARGAVLQEFEARYLRHLLARSQGNVRQAARLARMDRSYLIELLRRHGLSAAGST